jgi:hypothetical protein
MKTILATAAAAVISIALASLAIAYTFETYTNVRFAYAIDYPADLLIPQGEPDNGDGQRFVSRSRDVELLVVGSYNALEKSLRDRYMEELERDPRTDRRRTVTYKVFKSDWFVVSGTEGKSTFYTKVMLKDDTFKTMTFRCPAGRDAELTPLTAQIAKSFRHVEVEGERSGLR